AEFGPVEALPAKHVVAREVRGVGRGRPHTKFRVVVQQVVEIIGIEVVAAARVRACRDRDAFGIGRAAGAAELCYQPSTPTVVSRSIVLNHRVTGVAAGAGSAERRPQRAERRRPTEQRAALVEDGDLAVDHLHDVTVTGGVIFADGYVGIGRDVPAGADTAEFGFG